MDKDKKFLIGLGICTLICMIVLGVLLYSFVQVLASF